MRFGTCVGISTLEKLEEKLATLASYGFDCCQLSGGGQLRTEEGVAQILALLDKYGITPSGFWAGWSGPAVWDFYDGQMTLGIVPIEYRAQRIKEICDGADFAKKLGIKDVITHMGYIPMNPYDPAFHSFCIAARTIAQHLKKNDQYLLFETGQETPVAMLRCFEEIGMDNLGVNLDTANLILYGMANPVDALDVIGKYVRYMHAKDGMYPTNGHDLGKETRIGEGKVDFRALFTKLHELGYDSWVTIEREIEEGSQQMQDVLGARDYLKSLVEEIYS